MNTERPLCHTCGCEMASIRGHYPGDNRRVVCAQCLVEKLEAIVIDMETNGPVRDVEGGAV